MNLEPNKAHSPEQLGQMAVNARQSGANTEALKNYLSASWHFEMQKAQGIDQVLDPQKCLQSIIKAKTIAKIYGNLFGGLKKLSDKS